MEETRPKVQYYGNVQGRSDVQQKQKAAHAGENREVIDFGISPFSTRISRK